MAPNTIEAVLLSTREAGYLLGVDRRTIVLMCQRGDLPAVRIGEGGRWRVIRSGLERIIRDQPVRKDREHRPFDDLGPDKRDPLAATRVDPGLIERRVLDGDHRPNLRAVRGESVAVADSLTDGESKLALLVLLGRGLHLRHL
jgi:excisionase family DNA binding protein